MPNENTSKKVEFQEYLNLNETEIKKFLEKLPDIIKEEILEYRKLANAASEGDYKNTMTTNLEVYNGIEKKIEGIGMNILIDDYLKKLKNIETLEQAGKMGGRENGKNNETITIEHIYNQVLAMPIRQQLYNDHILGKFPDLAKFEYNIVKTVDKTALVLRPVLKWTM